MGMWEILEEGRDDYGRGFGMRGDEVEEAYKEGCRKGYEKAMREMRGEMGFRDGGRSYSGGGSSSGMDERRYPGYFLNIRVWMTWANADADALTVSFINGGGVK